MKRRDLTKIFTDMGYTARPGPQAKQRRSTKSHEVTLANFVLFRVISWIVFVAGTLLKQQETEIYVIGKEARRFL